MVSQLASFIGNQLQPKHNAQQQTQKSTQSIKPASTQVVGNPNPFKGNPFVATTVEKNPTFGKNMPVQGGFFAGYHNGQPNIVGARLFVEA